MDATNGRDEPNEPPRLPGPVKEEMMELIIIFLLMPVITVVGGCWLLLSYMLFEWTMKKVGIEAMFDRALRREWDG